MASIGNQMESARFIEFESPGVAVGVFEALQAEEAEGPAVVGGGGWSGADGPARVRGGEKREISRRAEDEGESVALGRGELEAACGGHGEGGAIANDDTEAAAAEGDIQGPSAVAKIEDIDEDGAGEE
jgi:hypothetical protein